VLALPESLNPLLRVPELLRDDPEEFRADDDDELPRPADESEPPP
jgi:hypothetical protein